MQKVQLRKVSLLLREAAMYFEGKSDEELKAALTREDSVLIAAYLPLLSLCEGMMLAHSTTSWVAVFQAGVVYSQSLLKGFYKNDELSVFSSPFFDLIRAIAQFGQEPQLEGFMLIWTELCGGEDKQQNLQIVKDLTSQCRRLLSISKP